MSAYPYLNSENIAIKQDISFPALGGVDIVTDKLSVNPGTLQECMNYEVGTEPGYKSVDGMMRYRGRSYYIIRTPSRSTANENFILNYTSKPYPYVVIDSIEVRGRVTDIHLQRKLYHYDFEDYVTPRGSVSSVELRPTLIEYSEYEPENISTRGSVESILLKPTLVAYDEYEPENISTRGSVISIELAPKLIEYNNYEEEGLTTRGSVTSITLQ